MNRAQWDTDIAHLLEERAGLQAVEDSEATNKFIEETEVAFDYLFQKFNEKWAPKV